jgi:hypothetical protein
VALRLDPRPDRWATIFPGRPLAIADGWARKRDSTGPPNRLQHSRPRRRWPHPPDTRHEQDRVPIDVGSKKEEDKLWTDGKAT